ncbi:MAG TPA: GYD domain-containing protein [Candidatus Acidoferrum sp.]
MPYFCHQISYTTDAWNSLVRNPQNRFDPIRVPIENLGGTIHATFFTAGNYDLLVISEFPETVPSSSIAVAFATGGAVACIQTTPLLSTTQAIESWRQSGLFHAAPSYEHAYHVMAAAAGS